ncbi:MAG: YetF domain-containing protein [Dyadobacter sp.]
MGKRGVKQLSVFETIIIIALGGAAGDPMFYKNVGLIHGIIVILTTVLIYRLVTWLALKSPWLEEMVEGNPVCLIENGEFNTQALKNTNLVENQFSAELRLSNIEHLGQVRQAFIETSGEISFLYFKDEEVRFGLPLSPLVYKQKKKEITEAGIYACVFCGNVEEVAVPLTEFYCEECNRHEWVKAINTIRIS